MDYNEFLTDLFITLTSVTEEIIKMFSMNTINDVFNE